MVLLLLAVTSAPGHSQQVPSNVVLSEQGVENAYPRLSKNGGSVLYQSNKTGNWQLYVLEIKSGKRRRLTTGNANNNLADWSPDNKQISFVSDRDGNEELYIMSLDGKHITRLTHNIGRDIHPYFSPDGKFLLFNSTRGNGSLDIYRYTIAGKKIERLTNTPENETCARYNSSMSAIVFLRNDEQRDDVYIMNLATRLCDNITNTPFVTDGWPMFDATGEMIYYSSMETGRYAIYRVKRDGTAKIQLSYPADGEEDARVFVARNHSIVYNRKKGNTIAILSSDVI
jgi:TolB protein